MIKPFARTGEGGAVSFGHFLGVGVSNSGDGRAERLDRAVPDVLALRELLTDAFDSKLLRNPAESTVRRLLKNLPGSVDAGPLVVLWCGHGLGSAADNLRLLARDSASAAAAGIGVSDLVAACAESGASQLLFLVDTCYSGAAVQASEVAARILRARPPTAEYVWVGVLASCLDVETARDGLFGERLRQVLTDGPETPELRVRWSPHSQFVRGDDVCDAVVKEWGSQVQSPEFSGRGSAWWVFPNPLYDPGAPEQVVEHLLQAARSGASLDEPSWFTGRTTEMNHVVGWVRAGQPGIYVITGSPGTGKSAIAGRVVSLSNPAERARLLADGHAWQHEDPGERSVQAHVHARGLTADRAAALIGGQLVTAGVLEPQPEPRNASELVGHLQRAAERGTTPPVVVVDGLDEARAEALAIAEELLTRLAPYTVIVASTRDLHRGDNRPSLMGILAPAGPDLDLDDLDAQDRTRADVAAYITARLADRDPGMDARAVAEYVAGEASMTRSRPFLLARLVADQLQARPVVTSASGWQDQVSHSIEDAFDADLTAVSAAPHRPGGLENDHGAARARQLLAALTWAYGRGFPEEEWLAAANALSPAAEFGRDDLLWLLGELGRYILQDGEGGVAVYRLAHQSLSEYLRPPFHPRPAELFDPGALAVTQSLAGRYRALLAAGIPAEDPAYLWRYLWRHAGDAGPAGLVALRDLAAKNADLQPDVAMAALQTAERSREWGRRLDAVAPAQEAAEIYRALAGDNPAFLPDLAGALNNLGICFSDVGRRQDAVAPAQEATGIYQALAGDNPAFLPNLAGALNNLGIRYGEVGRRQDAVAPAQEATDIYQALAGDNPAFLPDLAGALNNLGNSFSDVGRRQDAVAPAQEAAEIYRTLAADNPAFLPDLAGALNNLGIRFSEVGRRQDAVAPAKEATDIYQALAADNAAFLPDLAMALNNLGNRYSEVGAPERAESTWEDALSKLPADEAALLLVARAAAADAGHPEAGRWLATSLQPGSADRGLTAVIRKQARRHWAVNTDDFTRTWEQATGQSPPGWLTLEADLLAAAEDWIVTESYVEERDFLASHLELLDPGADEAVSEALLSVSEEEAERYSDLRRQARSDGVEAAYRPLLLTGLAYRFVAADLDEQGALLAAQREELLSDIVRHTVSSLADSGSAEGIRAHALLGLAELGDLELVLDALADLTKVPGLLHELAVRRDAASLGYAAAAAVSQATTPDQAATALFYSATAAAIAGNHEQAAQLLSRARHMDPGRANAWIAALAEIGQHHPAVLPLIPVLTQPIEEMGGPQPQAPDQRNAQVES